MAKLQLSDDFSRSPTSHHPPGARGPRSLRRFGQPHVVWPDCKVPGRRLRAPSRRPGRRAVQQPCSRG
jgi:hypothetical protein